ncbi:unnamed protein product [Ambrosiozyma monospora]|uniref:Unnamed protein product n=1 Tax=Ambrosiozyma monospora TaxID=43982 RepID=A0A9W6YQR0_AMBMO|nr:unnamed protein product [Ambrosiozyma monospora]
MFTSLQVHQITAHLAHLSLFSALCSLFSVHCTLELATFKAQLTTFYTILYYTTSSELSIPQLTIFTTTKTTTTTIMASNKGKTTASTYSTQSKLLLSQIIYDLLSNDIKHGIHSISCHQIISQFKSHKLINNPNFHLTDLQLLHLLNSMMVETKLLNANENDNEELPHELSFYFELNPGLITSMCNVYYLQRVDQLKSQVEVNQQLFRDELKVLKS